LFGIERGKPYIRKGIKEERKGIMEEDFSQFNEAPAVDQSRWKMYATHGILLVLTFITTTLAGVQWLNNDPLELRNFPLGLTYSFLLLLMLGSHEFGHYLMARRHGVRATLPFFLPFPSFLGFLVPFGTLGAVIRVRSTIPSRKVLFDIGAAGPIAGFVVSFAILAIGFVTLPPLEYLYTIHPEYAQMSVIPEGGIRFGDTILFSLLAETFAPQGAFIPPMNEVYHYPFLCVGWFGLFVTAMNLIPIGQLDGGHISSSMFGEKSHAIGQAGLVILVVIGLLGFLPLLGIDFKYGWSGWLFFALILMVFLRGVRLVRPPLADETPLDSGRMAVGWICYGMLLSSFSLAPFTVSSADMLF
jgi:membrane-associated protease RseP (regulator of RpoE activity)